MNRAISMTVLEKLWGWRQLPWSFRNSERLVSFQIAWCIVTKLSAKAGAHKTFYVLEQIKLVIKRIKVVKVFSCASRLYIYSGVYVVDFVHLSTAGGSHRLLTTITSESYNNRTSWNPTRMQVVSSFPLFKSWSCEAFRPVSALDGGDSGVQAAGPASLEHSQTCS